MINYKHIGIFLSFSLASCALYEPKYSEPFDVTKIKSEEGKIEKSFYLIGDAGYAPLGKSTDALMAFESYLENHKEKGNYAIFLGDNIYPAGMPKKGAEDRKISEHRLDMQIASVKNFDGEIIFIPGNHDWYNAGLKGLKREEDYFENKLNDKKLFYPSNGCALKSISVSDKIQLIILDSQWYLENWDNNPTINDDCPEIKTREAMFSEVESEFKKNQNKTIVFTLHHPLYTNGVHGGQYAPVKHIFPSQKKLPLPVLGSIAMLARTSGGVSIQDKQNKQYQSLVNRLTTLAKSAERIIFASGHEHSIQYIEHDGIKQIVSGSGAKSSYATLSNDGLFAYGGQGFVRLDIYESGTAWATFFSAKNGTPEMLYKKKIFEPLPEFDTSNIKLPANKVFASSVYESTNDAEKSDLYESIWGDHYRDLYYKKITAKVAVLDTLYGGLKVVRKGGGHQTRSLRLVDSLGKEYNMRALKKSGVKFLQSTVFKDNFVEKSLDNTVSEDILKDFYTASHPYIFLAIPTLSEALDIYHTNPSLFYVPKQPALGKYNAIHGDELYLIEERPEENHKDLASFGKPDDIESTADVYERLRRDEKYRIDEDSYIRARLFDMLIGDWDRHEDQWRWAEFKMDDGTHLFRPIPRDRDQAFSNFDGAFIGALRGIFGFAKRFQKYEEDPQNIKWLNAAALRLDRTLLQNATLKDWQKQAGFIKENLTDTVIETAFENIPQESYNENVEAIITTLKARRDNLDNIVNDYFKVHAHTMIVTGTDKDDFFEIERLPAGKTKISVYRIKKGKKKDIISERIFDKKYTKQIRIYGLDDDDVFESNGKANNPIKIRIIGGQNNDEYRLKSGKKMTVYDYKSKPNSLSTLNKSKVILTDKYELNHFYQWKNELSTLNVVPTIGFNPDDGVRLGPAISYTLYDFYKNPFTQNHVFSADYYFATQGYNLKYRGEFAGIIDKHNLLLEGLYTSSNYAVNFFGFGNNSSNFDNQDAISFDFNRVKLSQYKLAIGGVKNGRLGSYFEYSAVVEGNKVENTTGRFINTFDFQVNNPFDRKWFAGLETTYRYESYDNDVNPTRGMKFELQAGSRTNLNDADRTFGFIKPTLGFYNALTRNRKFVLKTTAFSHFNIGDDFEFYQSAQVGGENLLRGYRNQRFSGQTALAFSGDIRYSFNQFKTRILPLQFGVFTGVDTGRVWAREVSNSNKWHPNYGGGFWVNSADSVNGTFNLFVGEDGPRFSFSFLFKI